MSMKKYGKGLGVKGWTNYDSDQSRRHALASKGIRTRRKLIDYSSVGCSNVQRFQDDVRREISKEELHKLRSIVQRYAEPVVWKGLQTIDYSKVDYALKNLTPAQKKKFIDEGVSLLKNHIISGFQIEDYDPNERKALIFVHDNPDIIRQAKKELGGSIHDRESYYRWVYGWKLGDKTKLIRNDKYAKGEEEYISTDKITNKNIKLIDKKYTSKGTAVYGSWDVPDVRIYGEKKRRMFKEGYQIITPIDENTRLGMLTVSKKKSEIAKKKINGSVRKVLLQDLSPTEHSFYNVVKGKKN